MIDHGWMDGWIMAGWLTYMGHKPGPPTTRGSVDVLDETFLFIYLLNFI